MYWIRKFKVKTTSDPTPLSPQKMSSYSIDEVVKALESKGLKATKKLLLSESKSKKVRNPFLA